jgi:DNA-binding beta-propeller fold protein YncE
MKKSLLGKCALAFITGSLAVAAQAGPMLYVSDTFLGNVRAFDTATNLEVGDPIPVAHDHLLPPVVSPDGQFVYVQSTDGAISVIDTSLRAVARTFDNPNQDPESTDARPSMTLSPDGRTLYAIAADSSTIACIDTSTGAVVSHIDATLARDPTPVLRASHDGQRLYALSPSSGTIVAFDPGSGALLGRVALPLAGSSDGVTGFVVSADDATIAAVTYLGNLTTIDAATLTVRVSIPVGRTTWGVDLSPDGAHAFVPESNDGCIIDVDIVARTAIGTGVASNMCSSIAAARDGHGAYVASYDRGSATYSVLAFDSTDRSMTTVATVGYPSFDSQSIGGAVGTPAAGIWWNPEESGRSFNIEVRHGTLVLSAQTYDADGAPTWLLASGPYDAATGTFSGTFTRYAGGQCLGCAYRAPQGSPVDGGEVQLVFSSETRGTLTFDGVDIPIEKFDW